MRSIRLATATLALVASAAALSAADERPARYTMTPTEGGFLKLDTETGAVSLCKKSGDAFTCNLVPDSEQKLAKENEALRADLKRLKDDVKQLEEIAGLGEPKPGDGPPSEPRPGGQGKLQLPSEKDVDRAFDYFEAMMKKLKERLKRLEESQKPGTQL